MQGLSTGRLEIRVPACKKITIKKKPKQTRKPRRGRSPKLNVLTGPEPFPDILEFPRAFSLNTSQTGSPPGRRVSSLGRGSQPGVCPTRARAPGCGSNPGWAGPGTRTGWWEPAVQADASALPPGQNDPSVTWNSLGISYSTSCPRHAWGVK